MYAFLFSCIAFFLTADAPMKRAPCGSWESPITAQSIASGAVLFSELFLAPQGTLYWLERRPQEKGRVALLSWNEEEGEKELLPKEFNVRTRVHEYGGGALLVDEERVFFVNDADQQVYCLERGKIRQVTRNANARFADGRASGSSLFYVMEEHGDEVVNSIVRIDSETGSVEKIAEGQDFYACPRISPDGRTLAYLCWNHPNMPWDGTELRTLDLETGAENRIAGGASESIATPSWSPQGDLYYLSDRSNWWNLYRTGNSHPLFPMEAEFSLPQWVFGQTLYGFDRDQIACSYIVNGTSFFGVGKPGKQLKLLDLPYTAATYVSVQPGKMAFIASSPEEPPSILLFEINEGKERVIKRVKLPFPRGFLAKPQNLSFPSGSGRVAHAFYYPPTNPYFQGLEGEKPPLLVHCHGGPTAYDPPSYNSNALYWTSRGFAYMTVNYGGSAGYGRAYRDLLKGQWGVVDVEDSARAALYCVEMGLADPKRLAIEGGSSGGYTTLEALCQTRVFQVGADHFGVSDLERLALDTHKFESHYLDRLIGPYPEKKALYQERSPVDHVERLGSAAIIFQGDEDAIVPPSQSEEIYESLLARNIPTAYLLYKGEQHGFRRAENIQRTYEAQLYFFSKILGFPLNEKIAPVEIQNLNK